MVRAISVITQVWIFRDPIEDSGKIPVQQVRSRRYPYISSLSAVAPNKRMVKESNQSSQSSPSESEPGPSPTRIRAGSPDFAPLDP